MSYLKKKKLVWFVFGIKNKTQNDLQVTSLYYMFFIKVFNLFKNVVFLKKIV